MPKRRQGKTEQNFEVSCACGCGGIFLRYDRYKRARDYLPGHMRRGNAIKNFWKKVTKTESCWIWNGALTTAGYGSLTHKMERGYAHRVAFELTHGKIEGKAHLMHTCDNPACVNPNHLVPGSQYENMHDAFSKGRLLKDSKTGRFYGGISAPVRHAVS